MFSSNREFKAKPYSFTGFVLLWFLRRDARHFSGIKPFIFVITVA